MTLMTVISKSLYSTKCNNVDFSLINDFLKFLINLLNIKFTRYILDQVFG